MEENQNIVTTSETKEGSSFGWGVLGFFIPIVGLILFLVWMKTKTKASKAAGIGALIGGILEIISIVLLCLLFTGLFGNDKNAANIKIKKAIDKSDNFAISNYEYEFDFSESYLFAEKNYYNAIDESGKKIFTILRTDIKVSDGLKVDYTMVMNNGKEVPFEEYYSGIDPYEKYHFYYKDNLIIFNVKNDNKGYYFYDLDKNNLYTAFLEDESGNEDLVVKNIIKNNDDTIIFQTELNLGEYYDVTKKLIYDKVNSGEYNSLEDLENNLKTLDQDDFILKKDIVFKKGTIKYIKEEQNVQTIKDLYKEKYLKDEIVERTKDCIGKVSKGSNKYEYVMDIKNESSECKTLTYKLNDDFTFKFEISGNNGVEAANMYVNGKVVDSGLLYDQDIVYINGKTLITRAFSTDLGAPILLINTKGEIYSIEGYSEGKPYSGKDILNIDNKTKRGYKVDDNGNLIVSGTIHSNQCGDYLGTECVPNICGSSLEELLKNYNVDRDYAYEADYTFEQNNEGLYNLKYTKSTTTETLEQKYSSYCNR